MIRAIIIFEEVFIFFFFFFFFNDTATTEIYTLSLHDALPILDFDPDDESLDFLGARADRRCQRSEEHTSELQSRFDLVCRLLLEKKNKTKYQNIINLLELTFI